MPVARCPRMRPPRKALRLATLAGVDTIEHGNDGDLEVFRLMANKGVALCPTLAASEAMSRYSGWRQGSVPSRRR